VFANAGILKLSIALFTVALLLVCSMLYVVDARNFVRSGVVELTADQYAAIMRDQPSGSRIWRLGPFRNLEDCERAAQALHTTLKCTNL